MGREARDIVRSRSIEEARRLYTDIVTKGDSLNFEVTGRRLVAQIKSKLAETRSDIYVLCPDEKRESIQGVLSYVENCWQEAAEKVSEGIAARNGGSVSR